MNHLQNHQEIFKNSYSSIHIIEIEEKLYNKIKMPTNVFIQELEAEDIPGGYPTTPKSDRIGRDMTPILESQPPQDLKNTNDVRSVTENDAESESSNNIQQGTNESHVYAVNDESLPKKSTSDNVENNGFRNKAGENEESSNNVSSTPFLSKDSIPFDLNGDYNINTFPSSEIDSINGHETKHHATPIKTSESDSINGRETKHHVVPIKMSESDSINGRETNHHVTHIKPSENDGRATHHYVSPITTSPENMSYNEENHNTENNSINGRAMQNHVPQIKTSPKNSTSNDESPHYNTPTDSTANDPSSFDRNKNIINVLYTSREVGPDGVSGEKHPDQNDRSSHKSTKKSKINAKIGMLKKKLGKLINL
ncbi:14806_t:CDS:2 [Acaulospora morrowiae]|uniref:14806_t:CDS:1 n=1 Tax=Acaulospora morrowiae TaxID=94023 RepID=A0A9N8W9N9_9GLOM|nr:14806_t:CDS:2 [Acaulospora morrowiae]